MKKYGLNELREMFLVFFEEKDHLRLPSYSLIPQNDPSLLLINSGMAPMKTWFTGEQEPPRKRVCTCQKCIRTGDIENVGKTSRHGTYFEMLGNFSFGDYFKHEAIVWCWEFLTQRLGLDANLLYPSVYLEDDQAFEIWKDVVGVPSERICKLGKADNFWDHGSGPCGPCSEVYFDRGVENGCESPDCAPGCECDRFVEIWNNVFTQFSNDGEGNYSELSQKNIDTGMGLERLACVCQGVSNMFEVDTIMNIIKKVSEMSGVTYGASAQSDVSIRVITDHIRSATMMICDGVMLSNEGRGYVLRRLLRRAARHGRLLGMKGVFLHKLCATVINENKNAYPELVDKAGFIANVIRIEEENFGKTIDAGTSKLIGLIEEYNAKNETTLSGADIFRLYDTYGFPPDLTIEILEENAMDADLSSFDAHMEEQRVRARKAREALGDLAWAGVELGLDNTPTTFIGYENESGNGKILAIVTQGELSSSMREGDEGILVLDNTPFYAEKGGQSADFGVVTCTNGALFEVTGVQVSKGDKYMHYGKMRSGTLSVDDIVLAKIDVPRRHAIMRAHSATHLLHEILREVLGEHVTQAGSLVEPDKLRFDFTHFSALTKEEMSEIERRVNAEILEGHEVGSKEMHIEDAKKLGAVALFGEKYSEMVRVVEMGRSIELCGGTHLDNTAKTGAFAVIAEFSVASGVRRIEAITGRATLDALADARENLSVLTGLLKAGSPEELAGKVEQNMQTLKELRRELDAVLSKDASGEAKNILSEAKDIGGLKVITKIMGENTDASKLRQIEDTLRDMEPCVVSVLAAAGGEKITIVATCGKVAIEKGIKAGDIIKEAAKICGGSGGGKPDFAMGGGKDSEKLPEALEAVENIVKAKMGV